MTLTCSRSNVPTCMLSSSSYTYIVFLPQVVEIEVIFALQAPASKIQWANFEKCHIWAWNIVTDKSARNCTSTLFLSQGVEIGFLFTLQAAASKIRVDFQNCHIWAWHFTIGQSSRSCTYTLFLPQEVKIELIFTLRAAVSEIQADFQNCYIWAWNLAISQSARSFTYTHLLPPGSLNWAYFCTTISGFRDKGQFSQLPYLGMKLGKWPKFQKLHVYRLNYSRVPNFTPICSMIARFPDNWGFWFLHRVQWWIWNFRKKNQ